MKDIILEVKNLRKLSEGREILTDISLNIEKSQNIGIFGTSEEVFQLYQSLAGIDPIDGGEIMLNDKNFALAKEDEKARIRFTQMGLINTDYLLENQTIDKMFDFKLMYLREPKEDKAKRKEAVKDFTGIEDTYRIINELSQYEKVLVSIACSIIRSPSIIYSFNATKDLEKKESSKVLDLLSLISKSKGRTMIQFSDNWNDLKTSKILKIKNGKISK